MTINKLTDERLAKILSETQAKITEFNSRCARGSVEVDARLFEGLLIEVQVSRASSVFPGVMRCPICDFSRTHINVTPTGNYAGQSVQEDCPNGCGALCPDTYKRQYESLYDHFQQIEKEYEHDLRELQEYRKAGDKSAALASLEAEAVAFRSKLKPPYAGSERWDYTDHRQPDAFELENCFIERLYTAPPTPVAVPDFGALTKCIVQRLVDYGAADDDAIASAEVFVYSACRAAMLQAVPAELQECRKVVTPVVAEDIERAEQENI